MIIHGAHVDPWLLFGLMAAYAGICLAIIATRGDDKDEEN